MHLGKIDTRVDDYILKSALFAQPILMHIRELVHKACPNVEETIKWGMPSFEYKGLLCGMASFKQHGTFGFWKASLMKDKVLMENAQSETAMGHLGKLTSIKDLPSDKKILAWIKEAMELNEKGIKVKKTRPGKAAVVKEPEYFLKEIKKSKTAWAVYSALSQSHKNEYIEWIVEAKREVTQQARVEKTIAMLEESKSLNWKYMR